MRQLDTERNRSDFTVVAEISEAIVRENCISNPVAPFKSGTSTSNTVDGTWKEEHLFR